MLLYLMVCLWVIQTAYCDESILYDTSDPQWNRFRNWTIKELANDGTTRFIAHNSTKRLDIRPSNITFFTEVQVFSDVIAVHPAWEIFVTPYVTAKGKPFSRSEHCFEDFGDDCGTLKIRGIGKKQPNYRIFSGSNAFVSGQKYAAGLDDVSGALFKFVQLQFHFRFHYTFARPPRTLYDYVNITRVVVSYNNCPEIVYNLAVYPNVAAAREAKRRVESSGTCIENAERADTKGKLLRFCDAKAEAEFIGECSCSKGFQEENKRCVVCPQDHYRDNIKDAACTQCGLRTDVIKVRTECQCQEGFHRLAAERHIKIKDCYSYPNAPLEIEPINADHNHDVTINWKHPARKPSLGDFPFMYTIKCMDASLEAKICKEKPSTNFTSQTPNTTFVLKDTLPFTNYLLEVCTHTEVSLSNGFELDNCRQTRIMTSVGLPTKVRNFQNEIDAGGIRLAWEKPIAMGSQSFSYFVQCGKKNWTRVNIPSFYYSTALMVGVIDCTVKARSSVGFGPSVSQTITLNGGDVGDNAGKNSNSDNDVAMIGGTVAAVVILIIVGLLIFRFYRSKERNQNALVSAIETIMSIKESNLYGDNVRRELEHRMRNIYVPLDVLLNQSVVELSGEEPIYEEVPPQGYNFPYRKLKKMQDLGEGNFATVSQCEAVDICGCPGKSIVAVKQLKHDCNRTDELDFEGELELMQEFKFHPNVVKLLGICASPRCMVVEYLPGGDLLSFMVRSRKYRDQSEDVVTCTATAEGSFLTAADLLDFAHQISKGMAHIAGCRVVHRDLACRNILVGYNRICKIADFGLARKVNDSGIYRRENQAKLPVKWLPPESIHYGRSTLQSDVWSFGIVLWEIVTIGAVPYPGKKSKEVPELLKQGYRMEKPEHCSDELYHLMLKCWAEEDIHRPLFFDVVQNIEDLKNGMSSYINMNVYSDDSYLTFETDELDDEEIVVNVYL